MNIKEFAKRLDGRQYREEVTPEDREIAKQNGFLIIYGASDDLIEFDGIMIDETCVYGCNSLGFITWEYNGLFCIDSELPHEKFTIVDGDDPEHGNGIVIKIGE